ncbi:unnamed protein product [Symbiodinium sp. CCMP2592]|nr:unnamed protein product [Symbiodinium sp. CCMP2592]
MADEAVQPNIIIYSSLIGCLGASQWATAVAVLAGIVAQGFQLDVVAFGACISVCEKASQWQPAVQLLQYMDDCGMTPSNAAIAACFDQWPVALSLLQRAALTDAGSFAAVITSLGRGTQWAQALSLLDEMEERDLQPDILALSSGISACEKGAQWETALALLGSMAHKKVPPNVFSYASAVSACEKCQKWLEALFGYITDVLKFPLEGWDEQMFAESVQPNDVTLSAVMVAVSEQGLWEYCLGILQSHRSSVQCPNTAAFNAAISACEKGKQWQTALALIFDTQPMS